MSAENKLIWLFLSIFIGIVTVLIGLVRGDQYAKLEANTAPWNVLVWIGAGWILMGIINIFLPDSPNYKV